MRAFGNVKTTNISCEVASMCAWADAIAPERGNVYGKLSVKGHGGHPQSSAASTHAVHSFVSQ